MEPILPRKLPRDKERAMEGVSEGGFQVSARVCAEWAPFLLKRKR